MVVLLFSLELFFFFLVYFLHVFTTVRSMVASKLFCSLLLVVSDCSCYLNCEIELERR